MDKVTQALNELTRYVIWVSRINKTVEDSRPLTARELSAVAKRIQANLDDLVAAIAEAREEERAGTKARWTKPRIAETPRYAMESLVGRGSSSEDVRPYMEEARTCLCETIWNKRRLPRSWMGRRRCPNCRDRWDDMEIVWGSVV